VEDRRTPQLENGYTRLSNEWFEAFIAAAYPAAVKNFVLAVARETWGFHAGGADRPFRPVSTQRLSELLQVSERRVRQIRDDAIRHNLVEVEGEPSSGVVCSYRVQKDPLEWIEWRSTRRWTSEGRGSEGSEGRGSEGSEGRGSEGSEGRGSAMLKKGKKALKETPPTPPTAGAYGKTSPPARTTCEDYGSADGLRSDLGAVKQNYPNLNAACWSIAGWAPTYKDRLFQDLVTAIQHPTHWLRDEAMACALLKEFEPQPEEKHLPAKWLERMKAEGHDEPAEPWDPDLGYLKGEERRIRKLQLERQRRMNEEEAERERSRTVPAE